MIDSDEALESCRWHLEEIAIKYARMRIFGTFVDDRGVFLQHDVMRKDYEELYLRQLAQAAVDLLAEMTYKPLPPRMQNPN